MKKFNRLLAGAKAFATNKHAVRKIHPFALLTLVLIPACGITKSAVNNGAELRRRISDLDTFLTTTLPGSSTTTTRDRNGTNTLVILLNLSSYNLSRWPITEPLAKHPPSGQRYTFYYNASRRLGNYILGKIHPAEELMPRLVLALYADEDKEITWYNYDLESVMEPFPPTALPIVPSPITHNEWNCLGPYYIDKVPPPQQHLTNTPQYMVATITRTLQ